MKETKFQKDLITRLESDFPGCLVMKNDASRIQGIPDLLILFGKRWATLEVKRSSTATRRPNQDYYVKKMNEMSFAAIISPENKEEVLDALQQALRPRRQARVPKSK